MCKLAKCIGIEHVHQSNTICKQFALTTCMNTFPALHYSNEEERVKESQ